jgi:hypothetical protein
LTNILLFAALASHQTVCKRWNKGGHRWYRWTHVKQSTCRKVYLLTLRAACRSRDISVVAVMLGPTNTVSVPSRGKIFLSSPQRADRFWFPVLSYGHPHRSGPDSIPARRCGIYGGQWGFHGVLLRGPVLIPSTAPRLSCYRCCILSILVVSLNNELGGGGGMGTSDPGMKLKSAYCRD